MTRYNSQWHQTINEHRGPAGNDSNLHPLILEDAPFPSMEIAVDFHNPHVEVSISGQMESILKP
jgi:hypothetical protein